MVSFYDRRGDEIIYNCCILFIIIVISFILLGMGYANRVQNDWGSNRCSPFVIPFSSSENFNYCIQNIMSESIGELLYPINFILASFSSQVSNVAEGVNDIRKIGSQVRTGMSSSTTDIMGRVVNLTVPLQESIITTKDILGKSQGILTTGLYSGLGTYYTLKSSMGVVINSSIKTMIIMLAVMIPLLSNPFTAPFALPMVGAFTAISVLVIPIVERMSKDMGIHPDLSVPKLKIPKPRLCFAGNTKIKLRNGDVKRIDKINSGDILMHDGVVISTMVLLGGTEQMFKIDKTIVSGSHKIYDERWIQVKHCRRNRIRRINYRTNLLYCLVTSQRTITDIHGNIFKDWNDDIEIFEPNKITFYDPTVNVNGSEIQSVCVGMYIDENNLCVGVVKSNRGMQLITTNKSFNIIENNNIVEVGDYDTEAEA
jgi:hypothetical protein